MSFRADDGRRYGAVPPVQYPVDNQQQQQQQQQSYPVQRRPSFNNGDESSFGANATGHSDELFLRPLETAQSPTRQNHGSSAMSGYQHQYQAQTSPTMSTYNPQAFASSNTTATHSTTTSLPYHPRPSASVRYSGTSTSSGYTPSPTAYNNPAPLPYNPAAYSNTSPAVPSRQPTYHGYSNYNQSYTSPTSAQSPANYYSQQAATPTSQTSYEQALPSPPYNQSTAAPSTQAAPYDSSYSSYSGSSYYGGTYQSNGNPASASYSSGATSQAPYPTHSQIPAGPNYTDHSGSYTSLPSRSNSHASPLPSPSANSTIPQRHPTNAPLPNRPMADLPEEEPWSPNSGGVDDLMDEIEGQLGGSNRQRPMPINGALSDEDMDQLRRYNSTASTINAAADPGVNRYNSNASTINRNNAPYSFDYYESDPEGAYGVNAMLQAEQEDRRFSGGSSAHVYPGQMTAPLPPQPEVQESASDSDRVPFDVPVDLGALGGGFAGTMSYGNDVGSPPQTAPTSSGEPRPLPSPQQHSSAYTGYNTYQPFAEAGIDYGGTGGLQAPTQQHSYEDGDEQVSLHSRQSESDSLSNEEYPDMFFHPGISNRPLPAIPPASDSSSMLSVQPLSRGHSHSLSAESRPVYQSDGLSAYYQSQTQVERSISMSSHSNTPAVQAPARSQTDATAEKRKAMKMAQQSGTSFEGGYDANTPASMGYDMITLPTGRRRKLSPSKLTAADYNRCFEPWALSGISSWMRDMAEGELDLKQKTVEECLVKLFTFKVPTMNIADAETLSARVVESMFTEGILLPEEEWVKFGPGNMSGVLWQLTGLGCYAPRLHENKVEPPSGRCYSHHCTRTLKKASLDELHLAQNQNRPDWATFYGLTMDAVTASGKGKKEIERQNILHEIVTGEEDYILQLDVLKVLYRDRLRQWQPPLIAPGKMDKFITQVFGKVDVLQQCNKDHLLAQLKYRQKEQGPWIVGFSDLFREWIRKAKAIYIEYSYAFPYASFMVKKEKDRNVLFNNFLQEVQNHPLAKRLDYTTYLKAPITRIQRYSLLLETVRKQMKEPSEERTNLETAIEEIKAATQECDAKVAEMTKKVAMMELDASLVLRPGFHAILNLDHLGRELLYEGALTRVGSRGVRWVDAYVLLLDHYFILAKKIEPKDGKNNKKYDVSREPIPMPLLFLESSNDDPISRQRGVAAPLTRAAGGDTRTNTLAQRPTLEHASTGSNSITRLNSGDSGRDQNLLYPFKIKHLGHETYTLFANDINTRDTWCTKIIEAKTRHAQALYAQNAEPFSLRVIADTAFAYDSATALTRSSAQSVRDTPLDRAIREMEKIYGSGRGPAAVCRAQVNCATGFTAFGKSIIAIGTDYGVYISESTNPRGWTRTCQATKVTQIAILEEFSVCLLISNRDLISYPLDVIAPVSTYAAPPAHDNPRRAPHRLAKDVSFFATARMKDRMLVFYKKKEGVHNNFFNVLEPVFQKSTQQKRSLFGSRRGGSGTTETFRDFDQFYLPIECYSLSIFQTYIAVATAKGFEMLTLDKKQPMSIPDLKQPSIPSIANIASRVRDQRPLGMFKLNDSEFLLAYEDCAVYVDKHGDISRTLIMEYSGKQKKAKAATMYGQFLVLFNDDYVEIRNADNGRLRQIIAGRDVRCLDYGVRGPTGMSGTPIGGPANAHLPAAHHQPHNIHDPGYSKGTVKIAMQHPEIPSAQVVLELNLNNGHHE